MEEKSRLTTEQRRQKRIAELRSKLQTEEAALKASERKKRNGQLIAWGIMVEETFKNADVAGRQRLVENAEKFLLKKREKERALEGFQRLGWKQPEQQKNQRATPQKCIAKHDEVSPLFGRKGPIPAESRVELNAPYEDRGQVKAAGAQWDGDKKVWYVPEGSDLTQFEPWLPRSVDWKMYGLV